MSLQECFFENCTFRCPNKKNGCTFTYSGRDNSVTSTHLKECRYIEPKILANRNTNDVGSQASSTQCRQSNDTEIHSKRTNCKEEINSAKQEKSNQSEIRLRSHTHDKRNNNVERPKYFYTSSNHRPYKEDENTKAVSTERTSSAALREKYEKRLRSNYDDDDDDDDYDDDVTVEHVNIENSMDKARTFYQDDGLENSKDQARTFYHDDGLENSMDQARTFYQDDGLENSTDQAWTFYQDGGNMLLPRRSSNNTFLIPSSPKNDKKDKLTKPPYPKPTKSATTTEELNPAKQDKTKQSTLSAMTNAHDERFSNVGKKNILNNGYFSKVRQQSFQFPEQTMSSKEVFLMPSSPMNDIKDVKLTKPPYPKPTKSATTTEELNPANQDKTKQSTLSAMANAHDERFSNVGKENRLNNDYLSKVQQQSFQFPEQTMSSKEVGNDSETKRTEPEGFISSLKKWFRPTMGSQDVQKVPYHTYNMTSAFADTNEREFQLDDKLDTYTYEKTFNNLSDAYSLKSNGRFCKKQKPATCSKTNDRNILQAIHCTGRQQTAGFSSYRKKKEDQY